MGGKPFDKARFLRDLIEDIDTVAVTARRDLAALNRIAVILKSHRDNGNISELHYTVDKERLNRTIARCKRLQWELSQHREQAIQLLNE